MSLHDTARPLCGVGKILDNDRIAAEMLERDLLRAFSYGRRRDLIAALRAHPDDDGCCNPWAGRIIGLVTGDFYSWKMEEALVELGVDPSALDPSLWSWALLGAWLASRERSCS